MRGEPGADFAAATVAGEPVRRDARRSGADERGNEQGGEKEGCDRRIDE